MYKNDNWLTWEEKEDKMKHGITEIIQKMDYPNCVKRILFTGEAEFRKAKTLLYETYNSVKKLCGFEFNNLISSSHDKLMWNGYSIVLDCLISVLLFKQCNDSCIAPIIADLMSFPEIKHFYKRKSISRFHIPYWDGNQLSIKCEEISVGDALLLRGDTQLFELFVNGGLSIESFYGGYGKGLRNYTLVDAINISRCKGPVNPDFLRCLLRNGIEFDFHEPLIMGDTCLALGFEGYLFYYVSSVEHIKEYISLGLSGDLFYVYFLIDEKGLDEDFEKELVEFFGSSEYDFLWFDNFYILYTAIQYRFDETVDFLVDEGININELGSNNMTVLYTLFYNQLFREAEELLKYRPNLFKDNEFIGFQFINSVRKYLDEYTDDYYVSDIKKVFEKLLDNGLRLDILDEHENSVEFYINKYSMYYLKDVIRSKGTTISNQIESDIDSVNKSSNYIEELKELKELVDLGILTDEEFKVKKKSILDI